VSRSTVSRSTVSRSLHRAAPVRRPDLHRVAGWGVVAGVATTVTPLAFWWLPAATVYAKGRRA
jgi:hypothetical protein